MKYRVLIPGLTYPTNPHVVKRIMAGESVPLKERGMCPSHDVGDIVDDLPRASIPGLIKAGWIEEVNE